MNRLAIEGSWIYTPLIHEDSRGSFLEWFKTSALGGEVGSPLTVAQANCSVSCRGTIRGIHFAEVPPGQAKYVTCVSGSVLDVVVDLRLGSPSFGRWEAVPLDDERRCAVYIAEGLGHAFMALSEEATVVYLCSTPYDPDREHGINPLDPSIGIDWPLTGRPILSRKDADAPALSEAEQAGILPEYAGPAGRLAGPAACHAPDSSRLETHMRFLPDREDLKVAVIGVGYVGACISAALADRGLNVVGLDTDSKLIDELGRGHCRFSEPGLADLLFRGITAGRLRVTTDSAELGAADVVLITVGTPIRDDGSLADEQLRSACLGLSRHLRRGQLVVLKSTVPPGTTREMVLPLLERSGLVGGAEFGLAFTPERLAEGSALEELRAFPMVSGGLDTDSARDAAEFWQRALGVEVIPLDSLESAEIVKLADNWWIDLNIALGNELAKFCAIYGVDVLDVIRAANTIPKGTGKVNILLPSVGVGGSCLTKDPWMVWRSARRHGVDILTAPAGRKVNSGMPEYTGQLIADELQKMGKDPAAAKVAVLGLAFKNNSGDLRETPTQGAVKTLEKAGAEVRIFDPLMEAGHAEELFGIRPSASLHDAVKDVDCIAVLALHREFEEIDFATLPVAKPCLVLDGRAYYPKEKIAMLRRHGYAFRGIGR